MITTLLFDLDGLLTDTESLHIESYKLAFAEEGLAFDEAVYARHWIQEGLGIHEYCQREQIAVEPTALRAAKLKHYTRLVGEKVQPMPGAIEVLDRFHDLIPMALVTGAFEDSAGCVLDALGLRRYFKTIVTGSDVQRYKPDPEGFMLAATRMSADAAECLVIEDAEKGILAAASAGMKSIAIPTLHTATNDFSKATLILSSLHELTLDIVAGL